MKIKTFPAEEVEGQIQILLVEDEAAHADLVYWGFVAQAEPVKITIARNLAEARRFLVKAKPDIVVADLRLPDGKGVELAPVNKAAAVYPFIIMTSHGDEQAAVEAMKAGALDYVVKSDATLVDMPHIVKRALREWGHIMERRKAEEALQRKNTEFEAIFKAIPDSIVFANPALQIIMANPAFISVFGYSAEEFLGQQLAILYPDDISNPIEPIHHQQLRLYQKQYRRKNGQLFVGETVETIVRAPNGQVLGLLQIIRDVTEREYLEQQLRQAQKMETIGRLAGGITHDFNNILTVISGYSELLLFNHPDPYDPKHQDLAQIKHASQQASMLTRQLLTFSRKKSLRPQIVNLNEVVLGLKEILRRFIGEDISFVVTTAPEPLWFEADSGQIEQLIMNLVVNARDAMPRGGHLTIETAGVGRTEREAGSGQTRSYVLLVVADTGVGMDAQIKPHIFEPFFTTKEADKGTGIGLSTVYEIVRQYGGDIQVESEPGQGAVFSIYWPRVEAPAETGGLVSFALASHEGTETILVVEDEAEIRQVALKFLQKLGYIVLEAGTAQEAIRLYQQQQGQIDLLITDVVMSGMNGYELASYLTKSKPDLRVLYISGYADEIVRKYGPPPTAVLSKPFSLELLARRVRETLDSFRYETL